MKIPKLLIALRFLSAATLVSCLGSAQTYIERGVSYSEQGKHELAVADFSKAIEIDPNFAEPYRNRGVSYSKQGKYELARTDLEKAKQLYLDQGDVAWEGKINSVLREFPSQEANLNSAQAYIVRGISYAKQGKHELALADFNRAIKVDPSDVHAYRFRGISYDELGKDELAIADYSRAIEIDPNDAHVFSNRGVCYTQQGKDELALADFNQAIEIDPNYAWAYESRGVFYAKLGKEELARTNLEKAKQLYLAQGDAALAEEIDRILNLP